MAKETSPHESSAGRNISSPIFPKNSFVLGTVIVTFILLLAALAVFLRRPVAALWMLPVLALAAAFYCRRCRAQVYADMAFYKNVLDSSGPALLVIEPDGHIRYLNPAAERLLGYHASELKHLGLPRELLAPGEAEHLLAEMERRCGVTLSTSSSSTDMLAAYQECVHALPPSQVPSSSMQVQRKDGSKVLVTLHASALHGPNGEQRGLVTVAVDQSSTLQREQELRTSQENYRDLFENVAEMMAVLSPAGRFLYVTPAWRSCFGLDTEAMLNLDSFDHLFSPDASAEAAQLFLRAIDGKSVVRAPLSHCTPHGRTLELELSLSLRQQAGKPLALRCLLRDVTQQKQREHRLALQLAVSQILGENDAPQSAMHRILEALCLSQHWDLAILWSADSDKNRIEFNAAWSATDSQAEAMLQQSMGTSFARGDQMPGKVWQNGHAIWIANLSAVPATPRFVMAQDHQMRSGWAVPVRVDNRTLAVLEFYSRFVRCEDREAMAAIETAAFSLGQMLARSEEQGRAEELSRRQEVLLNAVAEGVCGLDRHGVVSFANPEAIRLLGATAPQFVGRSLHELFHAAAPKGHVCADDCLLRLTDVPQKIPSSETTIFRADGTSFPAEFALTPILDQGRFSGSVLSFRDASQRNALDQLKDEFISTVSHELRTPLTSIRGALGLLSSGMLGELGEKPAHLLRIALNNSDRLILLINDILDLERIQSGCKPLAFRSVQLNDLIGQALDSIALIAETTGIHLLHDATQVEIHGDPDRLLQVLTNLLSNAVKFSPAGSTISVLIHPDETGVLLSVIDHGRGIPTDKLESIFGRFQQVDASDARQKGGSGLGLAICRTIVQQHCGRIWAERNPVRGSTFRVFLPYHPEPHENREGLEANHEAILRTGTRPHVTADA